MRSSCSPHSYPYSAEQESLLTHPSHSHHPLSKHHPPPPPLLSRHFARRRDRRALSLELPELLRAGGQPPGHPPLHPDAGRRSGCGAGGSVTGGSGIGSGLGGGHRDCNGKTPGVHTRLMSEVFPQVNARKDRADLDEETDYVSPWNKTLIDLVKMRSFTAVAWSLLLRATENVNENCGGGRCSTGPEYYIM